MPRAIARALAVAFIVATQALPLALPPPTRAADSGLVVLADTTYDVLPEQARVHVTVEAVATSFEPNTDEQEVFFSGVTFAVQPGASNVAASADGAPLAARIAEQTEGYTAIEVTFAHGVFFQESYAYTVTFDLVDAGGAAGREFRIGTSLVAFPVWAFGTEGEPGSSVTVDLPPGYSPDVQGTGMQRANAATGGTLLSAEPDDPFAFFAYLTAERPGAFTESVVEVPVSSASRPVVIRAWEDDPQWAETASRLMTDGLPALEGLIGLDYPVAGRLSVEEAATSRLGEYAGMYDAATDVIRIRYDADPFVALHEAAHIWFNGTLWQDRWINEAWAEFYGVSAGTAIGTSGDTYELTDDLLAAQIPLNDWGAIGVESLQVEDFAYAATYELARSIADRTDLDGLRAVWRAAAGNEMSYQPIHGDGSPRTGASAGVESWQRLLDLLEERTGERYADLWADWVVRDDQQVLLASRSGARAQYATVVTEAGTWELPESIRVDMGEWDFTAARDALDDADSVLADRDAIAARARALRLAVPDDLRLAFEGDGGLAAAAAEADAQLDALDAVAAAEDRLDDSPSLLEQIGLLGVQPAIHLDRARDAFEDGDTGSAVAAADEARRQRDAALDSGTDRVVLAGTGVLFLDGIGLATASALRGRRRRGPPALAA